MIFLDNCFRRKVDSNWQNTKQAVVVTSNFGLEDYELVA